MRRAPGRRPSAAASWCCDRVLPALLRIRPRLSVLAAVGIIVLQLLAMGFHLMRGETMVLPLNVVLLVLAAFVLWGRTRAVPFAAGR